ncbi:MAG: hypothetical protein E3J21_26340 [Anaerolineales bacterium]|nr:MAG: hypothetical protein E3J21_26340 [Anaerolineales bacterium]
MPLTLEEYEEFVYDISNQFPAVRYSTLVFIRLDPLTAVVRGEVFFEGDIYLRVREVLDFDSGFLQTYSYEVYRDDEQLYWYDDWSHPDIPELTSTDPHHKHVPPDLKHHRVPAPHLSFCPNLPFLIKEILYTGQF